MATIAGPSTPSTRYVVTSSFLTWYVHHLALHPFPTRRSSDLDDKRRPPSARTLLGLAAEAEDAARSRSEEHTSELQSLRHLVCRLLLEKKKKKEKRRYQIEKNDEVRNQYRYDWTARDHGRTGS